MDSSSFANNPFLGFWVRLLTYIRSLTAAPVMVLDHNGLFARRFPIAFSGFVPQTFSGSISAGSTC